MFTYLIYRDFLSEPDSFWTWWHLTSMWGLGVFLDILALLVLYVAANALLASGRSSAADKARVRLTRLAAGLRGVDRIVMLLGGLMLAALVLITFVSVTGRTLYKPIPDDISFAEWALVALVALMLGTIQGREDHIEITALSDRLSYRVNLLFRVVGALIGLAIVGRLGWVSLEEVPDSFLEITYGSIYELPRWPPRLVFMAGLAWWLTRIAIQAMLLPAALRCDRRADLAWFDLWPLISRTGTGDVESAEALLVEDRESTTTGGARGA